MKDPMQRFSYNLKDIREHLDMTQVELGEMCDVHSSQISHYENGSREPGLTNIVKLLEGLGCSFERMLR